MGRRWIPTFLLAHIIENASLCYLKAEALKAIEQSTALKYNYRDINN
jgi:hypothetical protein